MLQIDQLRHKVTDRPMRGFFVRNKREKVLAIGALSAVDSDGFVMPSRKRYARDTDFCVALGKLTGLPVKWNLSWDHRRKRWQS